MNSLFGNLCVIIGFAVIDGGAVGEIITVVIECVVRGNRNNATVNYRIISRINQISRIVVLFVSTGFKNFEIGTVISDTNGVKTSKVAVCVESGIDIFAGNAASVISGGFGARSKISENNN